MKNEPKTSKGADEKLEWYPLKNNEYVISIIKEKKGNDTEKKW